MAFEAPKWANQQLDLRRVMGDWVGKVVKWHTPMPWEGGHDEGIFTRTFTGYYMMGGDDRALNFMTKLGDEFLNDEMVEACTCFLREEDAKPYGNARRRARHHGYQSDQSCLVHGPENYCWFLAQLVHINKDKRFLDMLEDAAHHIGNWVEECPPWYDWDKHCFRSIILGTELVRDYPPYNWETLTHVRVMVMATTMYYLTGESKWAEVAIDWCDKWADVVLAGKDDGFPGALFPVGGEEGKRLYGDWINARNMTVQYELANMFLDLSQYAEKPRYIEAVRKMIDETLERNDKQMGLLLAKYRRFTRDTSFDARLVELADGMIEDPMWAPVFLIMCKPLEGRYGYEGLQYMKIAPDGSERIEKDYRWVQTLVAAYQATLDHKYLERAFDLAWFRHLNGWYLWDGRELGCRGSWQGRNGIAMHNVIPVLCTSALGGYSLLEGEMPWVEVEYTREDGHMGLPEEVAALFEPTVPGERRLRLVSRLTEPVTFNIKPMNTKLSAKSAAIDNGSVTVESGVAKVTLTPESEGTLLITLG